MWRSLNHKFILPFLGIYEEKSISQLFLVTPYIENGTLAQWRKKENPPIAEIEQHVRFFLFRALWKLTLCKILEVAQGVAYIHSEGVVHGDIRGVSYLNKAYIEMLRLFSGQRPPRRQFPCSNRGFWPIASL